MGYRAFDTAQMYGNEAETGAALRATGLKRADLCITTKVHPDNFPEAKFLDSVEKSLKALQVDRSTCCCCTGRRWGDVAPSLRLLEQALARGLTENIGVSNYTVKMMREAVKIIDAPIVTNQVEFHPLLDQSVLMRGAEEVGIPLSSYSSVARGEVFKHGILPTSERVTVNLRRKWCCAGSAEGVSLNTMSTNPANIRANFEIMDFTLSHVDMARIDAMTKTGYRIVSAGLVPWAPGLGLTSSACLQPVMIFI